MTPPTTNSTPNHANVAEARPVIGNSAVKVGTVVVVSSGIVGDSLFTSVVVVLDDELLVVS